MPGQTVVHSGRRFQFLLGLLVAGFCFLLPDLIDKPLWVLGVIPDGRYMGHSILIVVLVAAVFGLARWTHGLVALFVGMVHLVSDRDLHSDNPWLYPFKQYVFYQNDYQSILTRENMFDALVQTLVLVGAALIVLAVYEGIALLARRLLGPDPDGSQAVSGAGQACDDNRRGPAHGDALCWTARIAGTLFSLTAGTYILATESDYSSSWMVIPAAACVLALTIAPSLLAWRAHRVGGAFLLIVCLACTELAHEVLDGTTFSHQILPFVAAWAVSGVLHLAVSWKEGRTSCETAAS